MDYASIKEESKRAVLEVIEKARLKEGDILVVGCSSSECCRHNKHNHGRGFHRFKADIHHV